VLRTSLTAFVANGAHVALRQGRSEVSDDVIMQSVIQEVVSLELGYLAVKHVTLQAPLYIYPILCQIELECV
jgi:hypothetical protein